MLSNVLSNVEHLITIFCSIKKYIHMQKLTPRFTHAHALKHLLCPKRASHFVITGKEKTF